MTGFPSRRMVFPQFAAAMAGVLLPRTGLIAAPDETPVSGIENSKLGALDRMMRQFVADNQVPGASLAVTRGGKLAYARGFGLANRDKKVPVLPQSLFRIASVSKPITATAILKLVERKRFSLDDKVVDLMGLKAHVEPGVAVDPRWNRITVRHCLQHTGGWDRDKSFDPIGRPRVIAKAIGNGPPVPPTDVVRYMMGQPLDFDPGERAAYSNLGYLVLGRIIAATSGLEYEAFVKKEVFGPLGLKHPQLGRATPEHRAKNEVSYYDPKQRTGRCLYPPDRDKTVPLPDGGMNFEGFEAHGGWIASTIDLVKFASAFDQPGASPLLSAKSIAEFSARPGGEAGTTKSGRLRDVYIGCGWSVRTVGMNKVNTWHTGYISGSTALLVRRHDGFNWAALFNTNDNAAGKSLPTLIDPLIHEAVNAVKEWPDRDLFSEYAKR